MRTECLVAFILSACSGSSSGPDAGAPCQPLFVTCPPVPADAGSTCEPPETGTQTCAPLDRFFQCLSTETAERQFLCDLATLRPEVVSSFTCREGIDWRLPMRARTRGPLRRVTAACS
jgi:hypothetical protein